MCITIVLNCSNLNLLFPVCLCASAHITPQSSKEISSCINSFQAFSWSVEDSGAIKSGLYVAQHLLLLLYQSIIQPIHSYSCTCFFNILPVINGAKLTRMTNTAARIIYLPTPNIEDLNMKAPVATSIAQDIKHPLNHHLTLQLQRRYRALRWRRAGFGKSLVPAAIVTLNNRLHWTGLRVECCLSLYVVTVCCCCLMCTVLWKLN